MSKSASSSFLGRVKAWQLIGLGLSGWCTLYSIALLTWGARSGLIGNAQGGCFAATMALAGLEARRYRKNVVNPAPADFLHWVNTVSTEQLHQAITNFLLKRDWRVEPCREFETGMGFGVRGVNTGRTVVFETARWKEPVINLAHVQSTEENRHQATADLAVVVGAGQPDEQARNFVATHPLQLLAGPELKNLLAENQPSDKQT
jgi:hypothetical protein